MGKYDITTSPKLLTLIDETLPKLKYSVNIRKVMRWLENFEENDITLAIDFLFFLEYIDYAELNFRINEQLEEAIKIIPANYNICILPGVATYPKSAELINYIIKDTSAYKSIEPRAKITRNPDDLIGTTVDTAVIFTDDFVGSGRSFRKGYDIKSGIKSKIDANSNIKERYLVAAIVMQEGIEFIEKNYKEVKILSETRDKIFNNATSPFNLKSNTQEMQNLALKYGSKLSTQPLGFSNSEALISFCHTSPNNTLPIIWNSENNWYPIFPRFSKDKILQSIEIKKEIAFYLGIMKRIGLQIIENLQDNTIQVRDINNKTNHRLICVMKLLTDGYEKPSICQILGITTSEYKEAIEDGKQRKLFSGLGEINQKGRDLITTLIKKVGQKNRFYKKEKSNFGLKYLNYVPKSFGGVT